MFLLLILAESFMKAFAKLLLESILHTRRNRV
jgi:hypothetical protein